MIYKDSRGIYSISSFAQLPITAAYSCRVLGDMRRAASLDAFLRLVGSEAKDLIMARQIHGVRVALVSGDDRGKTLSETDGLVYKKDGRPVVLGVSFADCVPLLAVDPGTHVIGVAHAGWRGTVNGIAGELVSTMVDTGCVAGNIRVSIGPHIGMCCYTVQEPRVREFQNAFGPDEKIAVAIAGGWHLDIGYVNYMQLVRAGITKEHLDAPVTCTSCQASEFNSFRKDTKETFGVQLGIIRF
jgi:YfiH family protein